MKKINIVLFALALAITISAQVKTSPIWATYEAGDELLLPNYEFEGVATLSITDNPSTTGINKSAKCFLVADTEGHQWWNKLKLKPQTDFVIKQFTAKHVYLHFKCFRTRVGEASEIQIFNAQNTLIFQKQFNSTKAGVWEDIVFDLTGKIENQEIGLIWILPELNFNNNVTATSYYFDDIKLVESSYPDGVNLLSVNKIVNFDNETLTQQNISEIKVQSAEASYSIVNNPKITTVNPSSKVLRYSKPANTTWWHALQLYVNGLIKVEYPNTYLHFMLYNPSGAPVAALVDDHTGKQISNKYYIYDTQEWEDFVVDLSDITTIKDINFRFDVSTEDNWANPAGFYYVDDILLNADFAPRSTISGIKDLKIKLLSVINENEKIYVKGAEMTSITIFSVNGSKLVEKSGLFNEASFNLQKGTFIVKAKFSDGTSEVQLVVR